MSEVLQIMETGRLSESRIQALLQSNVIKSRYSYHILMEHMEKRTGIQKRFLIMCASEHAAMEYQNAGTNCEVTNCVLTVQESHKFWYREVSELLRALCKEQKPFEQFMNTCRLAQKAVEEIETRQTFDFYDGLLFRELYADTMRDWDENNEIIVFLTLSSDGFEEFSGRTGSRTAWPIVFTLLSYGSEHRFRARNILISGFIPGSHSAEHFDTFLNPIVQDLLKLQEGINVMCPDLRKRKLRGFVLFTTFDTPAASKSMGFLGHNALHFCRCCLKKASKAAGGRYAIPSGSVQMRRAACRTAIKGHSFEWLMTETPDIRGDLDIREVWDILERMKGDETVSNREMATICKQSGLSRKPLLSLLNIDVSKAVPYDPMHLLYLGWVKHLIRLLFGLHPKGDDDRTYILSRSQVMRMNNSLSSGFKGVPGEWGRPPCSIENIAGFRAIDYKYFGLYYGPILFSGGHGSRKIARLWNCTSNIISIASDATPMAYDCERLKRLVQEAHALFTDVFYLDSDCGYCFTPTTHFLLHLPDMLANCGPLPNVSQWIVERLIGDVGELIGSQTRPEANLFHKTHKLFTLRLFNGGLEARTELSDESSKAVSRRHQCDEEFCITSGIEYSGIDDGRCTFIGSSHDIADNRLLEEIIAYTQGAIGETVEDVRIVKLLSFRGARIRQAGGHVADVETQEHYIERDKKRANSARQKCWVAACFDETKQSTLADPPCGIETKYFGRTIGLFQVFATYKPPNEETRYGRILPVAKIAWQYGMVRDAITNVPSVKLGRGPRRGSVRHKLLSIENLCCIRYVMGFFDYEGRRYFIDPDGSRGSDRERLGGLL